MSSRNKPRSPKPPPGAFPRSVPTWLTRVLLALTALFLLGLFSTEFADTDSWWHLKTGQYIVQQHRLPYPDPFAYTTALVPTTPPEASLQHFNLTHEWLAQAALYLVYSLGGFGAVVLSKAFLLALACALTGFVAARRARSLIWAVAAALAASSVLASFAHDRPSILSYLFVVLFIAILEHGGFLWLLPPLALLWANSHGGHFLGWIVCGAYCVDALLRRAPNLRPLLLYSAGAVLVSGINPNGFGVISTLFRYRDSPMTASLTEWSKPGLWDEPYGFYLLFYGALAVAVLSWRRVRISDWLLFAAFAAAAFSAFRNEPLIALFAPILIAAYFPRPRALPPLASYGGAAVLAAALIVGLIRGSFFQLRAAEWRFPSGAATFLQEHNLTSRIFNTYEHGGYLIWRGIPDFIDGRSLSDKLFVDYETILGVPPNDPRRDQLLDRYGVRAIVLNGFEYNSGTLYLLALALTQPSESAWKLVYDDPAALVFVRDLPPGAAALDKSRILDHLESECFLHVQRDPEFSLCARTLGDVFIQNNDPVRARRAFRLYLDHPYNGDDPVARQRYLQLGGH
jgi:hypothetical protein